VCDLKKIVIAILFLVSNMAYAEWTSVGRFDNGNFYIDKQSMIRKGDQREIWTLMDYRFVQMDGNKNVFRSSRSMMQLHCVEKKARIIHMSFFSGSMLRGNEVGKMGTLKEWEPVPPDTPIYRILEVTCGL
jgi:hypothetical protein